MNKVNLSGEFYVKCHNCWSSDIVLTIVSDIEPKYLNCKCLSCNKEKTIFMPDIEINTVEEAMKVEASLRKAMDDKRRKKFLGDPREIA